LAPCTDGFAQRHVDRDSSNKAAELSLSWMSIRQDNGGERPAYDVLMIGVPHWM